MVWMALGLLAILPGILLVVYIYNKDAVEKEPKGLLIKLFLFGCLSIIPVYFVEGVLQSVYPAFEDGSFAYSLTIGFLSAALVEELFKLMALFIGSWWSKAFDYRFDAIVYAVAIAVGFATIENIMYVFVYNYGFETAIIRGFVSVPGHVYDGVFMGIMYGAAKEATVKKETGKKLAYFGAAFFVPFLSHGIWDTLCFLEYGIAGMILLAFIWVLYKVTKWLVNRYAEEDYSFYSDKSDKDEGNTWFDDEIVLRAVGIASHGFGYRKK